MDQVKLITAVITVVLVSGLFWLKRKPKLSDKSTSKCEKLANALRPSPTTPKKPELPSTIKLRHERILRAKPKTKPSQNVLDEDSSEEDDMYVLGREESKDVSKHGPVLHINDFDYKSTQPPLSKDDKGKPYATLDYSGYSSFRPNPSVYDFYLSDKNENILDDRRRLSNWNRRFRRCISVIRNLEPTASLGPRIEANLNLMHLSQDFIYAATSYGKIIISEYYLPLKCKTIKPTDLGGVLGGQKYVVHNILFKFAVDSSGLFGGEFAAAKVAGNELRGLMGYFNCHINELNLPLLALVDYRGFRLIAMSILPVTNETIIYGSCDAGRNIHATDSDLNQLMAKAAVMQNLKPHECRIARKDFRHDEVDRKPFVDGPTPKSKRSSLSPSQARQKEFAALPSQMDKKFRRRSERIPQHSRRGSGGYYQPPSPTGPAPSFPSSFQYISEEGSSRSFEPSGITFPYGDFVSSASSPGRRRSGTSSASSFSIDEETRFSNSTGGSGGGSSNFVASKKSSGRMPIGGQEVLKEEMVNRRSSAANSPRLESGFFGMEFLEEREKEAMYSNAMKRKSTGIEKEEEQSMRSPSGIQQITDKKEREKKGRRRKRGGGGGYVGINEDSDNYTTSYKDMDFGRGSVSPSDNSADSIEITSSSSEDDDWFLVGGGWESDSNRPESNHKNRLYESTPAGGLKAREAVEACRRTASEGIRHQVHKRTSSGETPVGFPMAPSTPVTPAEGLRGAGIRRTISSERPVPAPNHKRTPSHDGSGGRGQHHWTSLMEGQPDSLTGSNGRSQDKRRSPSIDRVPGIRLPGAAPRREVLSSPYYSSEPPSPRQSQLQQSQPRDMSPRKQRPESARQQQTPHRDSSPRKIRADPTSPKPVTQDPPSPRQQGYPRDISPRKLHFDPPSPRQQHQQRQSSPHDRHESPLRQLLESAEDIEEEDVFDAGRYYSESLSTDQEPYQPPPRVHQADLADARKVRHGQSSPSLSPRTNILEDTSSPRRVPFQESPRSARVHSHQLESPKGLPSDTIYRPDNIHIHFHASQPSASSPSLLFPPSSSLKKLHSFPVARTSSVTTFHKSDEIPRPNFRDTASPGKSIGNYMSSFDEPHTPATNSTRSILTTTSRAIPTRRSNKSTPASSPASSPKHSPSTDSFFSREYNKGDSPNRRGIINSNQTSPNRPLDAVDNNYSEFSQSTPIRTSTSSGLRKSHDAAPVSLTYMSPNTTMASISMTTPPSMRSTDRRRSQRVELDKQRMYTGYSVNGLGAWNDNNNGHSLSHFSSINTNDDRGGDVVHQVKKRRAVLSYQYANEEISTLRDEDLWMGTEIMYSPADLEGHRGKDGRFYLLDFSRVLPPETPNPKFKNSHLSRLLRPEFVQDYYKPLCSDAFSGFIKGTTGEQESNAEIVEATNYLLNVLIPKFAKELSRLMEEAREQGRLKRFRLTETAHSAGVNCRHFGQLRKLLPDRDFKEIVLLEITARCLKNTIRWKFREKMRQIALPMEEPYRRLVINHFNLVFGNTKMSDRYWDEVLKKDCSVNFQDSLSEEELQSEFHLKLRKPNSNEINTEFLYSLYTKVVQMMGMKFTFGPSRETSFQTPDTDPFDDTDLETIGEHVKHMNIISHAQGYFYHVKGLLSRKDDPELAHKFYEIAIEKFSDALNSDPNNKEILLSMAFTWTLMIEDSYKQTPNAKFDRNDPKVKKVEEYSLRAIFAEPKYDSFSLFRYAQFLEKCGRYEDAEDYYLMSLEADPDNIGCLHCYGNTLAERGFKEEAEKFFSRASQQSVGLSQWPYWEH